VPKQYIAILAVGLAYMLGVNMPYSLEIRPIYGTTLDWIGWISYMFVAASFILVTFVFFISNLIFRKFKEPKIREDQEIANIQRL
jgi:hypothetical protein